MEENCKVALVTGAVDFTAVSEASILGSPVIPEAFAKFDISAIITIMPIALATIVIINNRESSTTEPSNELQRRFPRIRQVQTALKFPVNVLYVTAKRR